MGGVEAEVVKILYIPSAGKCSPTVIDKRQPIESMRSRLRVGKYEVIEGVDFLIQLLYIIFKVELLNMRKLILILSTE